MSPDPSQDPRQGLTPSPWPATTTCVSAKAAQAGLFPQPAFCAMPPAVRSTRQTGCLLSPLRGGTFCIGYCTLARYPAPPPPSLEAGFHLSLDIWLHSGLRVEVCGHCFAASQPSAKTQAPSLDLEAEAKGLFGGIFQGIVAGSAGSAGSARTALGSGCEWDVLSDPLFSGTVERTLQHFSNATRVPIAATAGKSEERVLDARRASSGQSRRPTSARTVAMVDRRTPSPLPVSCCHGHVATLTPRLREAKRFNFPFTGFHGAPAGCGFAMLCVQKFILRGTPISAG